MLPDFCIPRRQHGAAVLGAFLAGYAAGKPLVAALRKGFLARGARIRAYLARLRARALEPPPATPGCRSEVRVLVAALCLGFVKAAAAFIHHGVGLHAMQQVGLA